MMEMHFLIKTSKFITKLAWALSVLKITKF
jgi:hypothetical protein